ncbi:variable surface protein [Plasmodium gonderi]|uniref:Variable surface protein n=1 Tax=Plasmodium gonderi TaxID=77519 RepID=A0A1Y1JT34_PLAGO|nr:variable surface protein [Plasmodium gonderi]GAW84598.1 variable surface protein [Plasmodium gonderi]
MSTDYYAIEDYIFFKEIFDTTVGTEVNTDDINIFLNPEYRTIESTIRDRFIHSCKRIKKYFEYFKKEDSCNNSECCNFINYWINKKIREFIDIDFKSKWYIFRYFIEYVHYNNNDDKYNRCIKDINYMNKDLFDKVNDTSLVKELNKIRCLIENIDWKSNDNCKEELSRLSNDNYSNDYDITCKSLKEIGYVQRYSRLFEADFLLPPSSTNTSIKTIIRTVFIIIIVGVIFLGFYKVNKNTFTPFRHYLYLIIIRMGKTLKKTNEESYEDHFTEYDNNSMDLEEKMYNIMYICRSKS